ncbi:TPA: ABC transporter permease [Streptococcus suis]
MRNVRMLYLLPVIILLMLFLVLPLLSMLAPTFVWTGNPLQHYFDFIQSSYNLRIMWRTLWTALVVTLVCAVFGIPTAFFISGLSKKWKGILMAITLFPMLTNSVIRAFAWITILGKNGVINRLLEFLGVINQPLSLLYTDFAIIIGSVYLFLPTMIITLVGVMDGIDNEILEAGQTLGLSPLGVFRKIIVPLSMPGTIVGSILVFTGTLTAYTTPQLLGGNKKMVLATFLRQQAMTLGNWQTASVIAALMVILTLLVMKGLNLAASRLDKRELKGGAI